MEQVGRATCPSEVPEGERSVEIVLPDGTCVRVGADVDAAALRRVLAALRR